MITKEMVLAEATANVLRVKELVKQLTCDIPDDVTEIANIVQSAKNNGNLDELALVLAKELRQVRSAVLNYQPRLYTIG